jgi:hypothetical protein
MEPDGNSSVAPTPAWHSIGARAFPAPAWHYGKTSTPQGIPNTDGIDYSQRRAVVVVEGATLATFVTGTITMLIIGILLNIVGLGIFCWALFALATHALPVLRRHDRGNLFISSWSRSVRRHRRRLRRG